MEEMEQDRLAKEAKEAMIAKEREGAAAANAQWESDKQALGRAASPDDKPTPAAGLSANPPVIELLPEKDKAVEQSRGSINGPLAHAGEELAERRIAEPGRPNPPAVEGASENGITPDSASPENQAERHP
jgi:hypothetical protein